MDFKFIVLALVISTAAGEAAEKNESLVIRTNNKAFESNKNEELHNEKDDITSKKTEKPILDMRNIATGMPIDLADKPVKDTNKSTNDTDVTTPNKINPPVTSIITNMTTSIKTTTQTPTTTSVYTSTTTAASDPEEEKWVVNNGTFCIMMQMQIEFNITYPGNDSQLQNTTFSVPKGANSTGNCGVTNQNIYVTWGSGNNFTITFTRNETTEKFQVNSSSLTINTTDFKNIRDGVTTMTYASDKLDFPIIPLRMSYKCDKQLKQILYSDKYNATLLLSHTQFQAFMDNKTVFGKVKDCDEFDTPDIVPIAVGCVLSILVVIFLVAYLIGRRRSQSRGYLSM